MKYAFDGRPAPWRFGGCCIRSIPYPCKAMEACRFKKTRAILSAEARHEQDHQDPADSGGRGGWVLPGVLRGGALIFWQVQEHQRRSHCRRKVTSDIATIDIPESFEPIGSIDIFVMKGVAYKEKSDKGILMIGEFKTGGDVKAQSEQMQMQFRQAFNNGRHGSNEQDLIVEKRETREFTVRGSKVPFEFETGKAKEGEEMLRVTGTFPSKGGAGVLVLMVPTEEFDEDDIATMIEFDPLTLRPSRHPLAGVVPRFCATGVKLGIGSAQAREPPRQARWRSVARGTEASSGAGYWVLHPDASVDSLLRRSSAAQLHQVERQHSRGERHPDAKLVA